MPYGPMWCRDCGFRVEEKMDTPNPFLEAGKEERASHSQGEAGSAGSVVNRRCARSRLRAALYGLLRVATRRGEDDQPEETPGIGQDAEPADDER